MKNVLLFPITRNHFFHGVGVKGTEKAMPQKTHAGYDVSSLSLSGSLAARIHEKPLTVKWLCTPHLHRNLWADLLLQESMKNLLQWNGCALHTSIETFGHVCVKAFLRNDKITTSAKSMVNEYHGKGVPQKLYFYVWCKFPFLNESMLMLFGGNFVV